MSLEDIKSINTLKGDGQGNNYTNTTYSKKSKGNSVGFINN